MHWAMLHSSVYASRAGLANLFLMRYGVLLPAWPAHAASAAGADKNISFVALFTQTCLPRPACHTVVHPSGALGGGDGGGARGRGKESHPPRQSLRSEGRPAALLVRAEA